MTNNIAVSITADVADLTAKRAIASAELKALQKDLNDLANTARTTGRTPELNAALLAAGDAAAKARSEVNLINAQLRALGPAAEGARGGVSGITGEIVVLSREMLKFGREAGRGNLSRMAGSATLLAQRMGELTPAVLIAGAAIAGIAAPFAIFAVAMEQGSQEMARFQNAMEATNGYAGVTFSQLQQLASGLANWGNEGIGAATKELEALAASGRFTGDTLALVGADATRMSQLTGESADKWNAEFEKMSDGVAKFAAEYQAKYGQLTTAQFQYIQQLEQQGQKESAEHALAKDVYDYLGSSAPQQLGILEGMWRQLGQVVSATWETMKSVGRESIADQIAVLQSSIQQQAGFGLTAKNSGYVRDLELQLATLQKVESASETIAGWQAKATQTQKEGVSAAQKLHEQFEASKTSGEKLKAVLDQINDDLAKAIKADPGQKDLFEKEAVGARSQAKKSDASSHGLDQVAEWEQAFQAQTVAANNFFGDETQAELTFWQGKLALVQKNSKDWLAISTKIYDAQKALAHESYDDELASLGEQLEANKNSWGEEQSIWAEKLAIIGLNYGAQSKQLSDANKEFEAAELAHQQKMAQIAQEGAQKALASLKTSLDAQKALRQQDADQQIAQIEATAKYSASPTREITAAQQVMTLHQQLLTQELADEQAYQVARDALLQKEVATAAAAYGQDSTEYKKAVDAKAQADQQFSVQYQQLQAKLVSQTQADALKIQSAWHSAIDPVVNSFGSAVTGMIKGTETLSQALEGVGEAILNVIITAIERWVSAQIVAMVTGQAAGKTAALSQIASNVAMAGSGAVASMAAAPWPLDLTAPAFGAAMAATAASLGSLASFDVGTNFVPHDMVAQIHQGERIIPAGDNAALMQAVGAGGRPSGANPGGGGRSRGGDTYNVYAMDSSSFEGWINQPSNAGVMRRFASRQARNLQTV